MSHPLTRRSVSLRLRRACAYLSRLCALPTAASFAVALALSACDASDGTEPALEATSTSAQFSVQGQGNGRRVRAEEAEFFELAAEIPGFGGYSFDDDGNLVAHIKGSNSDKEAKALRRLTPILNGRANGLARRGGRVVFKAAKHSFPELAAWRDTLTATLFGQGLGVTLTDADEHNNVVTVGVSRRGDKQRVAQIIRDLNVPQDAVSLVEEDEWGYEEPSDGAAVSAPGYLGSTNTYFAHRGGLPVYMEGNKYCTTSLYAYSSHEHRIVGVSNAHCSNDRVTGGADGTRFYAYYVSNPSTLLGQEVFDRGYHDYCPKWYNVLRWCRNADAMLFSVVAGAPETAVGYIARPALINPGDSDDPIYQQIDFRNPSFRITSRNSTRRGEAVNKVGARTGWTQGTITATCKDVDILWIVTLPQPVIQCQHEASYARDHGDSGAPVFAINADGTADLRGVHWGRYLQGAGFKTVFSPLGRIEDDLGALNVIAPAPPAPVIYAVAISGSNRPSAESFQTWTATVTSGAGPFTYRWYVDESLVQEMVSEASSDTYSSGIGAYAFELRVDVVDGRGETVSSTSYIEPYDCPDPTSMSCVAIN